MHPILFKMGSFNLPTYGFLLVMAILVAIYRVMRRGRREGLDPNQCWISAPGLFWWGCWLRFL